MARKGLNSVAVLYLCFHWLPNDSVIFRAIYIYIICGVGWGRGGVLELLILVGIVDLLIAFITALFSALEQTHVTDYAFVACDSK